MKKGFTLIELLAVIVILAIIALIATPIVLRIIDNSKTSAVVRSAELYMDSINQVIMRENLKSKFSPSTCTIQSDGDLLCDDKELEIEVSGEKPTGGTITLEDGKITGVQDMTLGGYVLETDEKGNIVIKGTSSKDDEEDKEEDEEIIQNVSEPDLYNGALTPVTYNGTDWIVADPSAEWYSYENQEWANAVILKSGVTKSAGQTVTVDGTDPDALAMFVWIPRYEYKIDGDYGKGGSSAASPGEIEVNFISKETTSATNGYIIHPAFWWDNDSDGTREAGEELSGIWVGKFETSHTTLSSSESSNNLSCTDNNCTNAAELRILPNVQSIRYNNVSNFFYAGLSMTRNGNPFGLSRATTDSHMMKNSEWGAVAYLSQSKYGKYGNVNFSEAEKEVYINNSNQNYTGRSGGNVGGSTPTVQETFEGQSSTDQYSTYGYYTYDGYKLNYSGVKTTTKDILKGTGASTTGNIYGVYDMSGGSGEYVMGYYTPAYGSGTWGSTGSLLKNDAGFESEPDKKYYDAYTATSSTTACNGNICYGHALSETSAWYGGRSIFIASLSPWVIRGGHSSSGPNAGVFILNGTSGYDREIYTFRVVLSRATES